MNYTNGGTMPWHHECLFRNIAGSVGHLRKECQCFGGEGNGEPEGMTLREGAVAALEEWHRQLREQA